MRVLEKLTRAFDWVAGWIVLASMTLVAGNVIMRLFGRPITGSYEWTGFLTALAISLGLAYCALHGGHTVITLLVDLFPKRLRKIDRIFARTLTAAFLAMAAWRMVVFGESLRTSGEVSPTTKIPIHPFTFLVAAGLLLYAAVELSKVVRLVTGRDGVEAEEEPYLAFAPHDACPVVVLAEERAQAAAREPQHAPVEDGRGPVL